MSLKYWVGLSLVPGIGSIRIKNLIDHFGSPERVWKASGDELATVPAIGPKTVAVLLKARKEIDLDRFIRQCTVAEIRMVSPEDSEFPANLRHIFDPPPVLYYRGELKEEDSFSMAMVGSRKMTSYGRRVSQMLAKELVLRGCTVVSGMALGVDGVAHKSVLEAGGRTIAVMGSGVDVIYPPEHRSLYSEIIGSGSAVISIFPPGTPPEKGNFPARNRIISGISRGTIVIEAGARSGALITADQALEQDREVFAVPGSIFSPLSEGTNRLIQKGAKLVLNIDDIFDELEGSIQTGCSNDPHPSHQEVLTLQQLKVINLLSEGDRGVDELLTEIQLSMAELNIILFELELKGLIKQLPGLKFTLV